MKKKPADTAKCFGFYAFMFSMRKTILETVVKIKFYFFSEIIFQPHIGFKPVF